MGLDSPSPFSWRKPAPNVAQTTPKSAAFAIQHRRRTGIPRHSLALLVAQIDAERRPGAPLLNGAAMPHPRRNYVARNCVARNSLALEAGSNSPESLQRMADGHESRATAGQGAPVR
jgi:hypothetical protein